MDFDMLFRILIFDPKRGFCKAYSLSMIADFQNGLIGGVYSVFSSGFLHRTTINDFWNGFWQVFYNLIFDLKWGFYKAYSLCMMTDF